MSFELERLTIATNNMKAGNVPSLWTYYNEDNDAVTATSYFAFPRLTIGDQIMVYRQEVGVGSQLYRVSAKTTAGLCTAVQVPTTYLTASDEEVVTFVAQLAVNASLNTLVTHVVTSAANTTGTFTAGTVANENSYITLGTAPIDGTRFLLTTATTLPAGLAAATIYYAVNSTGFKCQLSLTHGGDPVTITDAGTGVHTATATGNQLMIQDGYEGQRKIIKFLTDGTADLRIVPTNFLDVAGDALAETALDSLSLVFANGKWNIIENTGCTLAVFAST